MWRPRLKLAVRLFVSFLGPLVVALLLLALLADDVAQRSFERQRSERLIDMGLAVRSRFAGNYYSDPEFWSSRLDPANKNMMDGLRQRVDPLWKETGVRRVFLFSPTKETSFFDTQPGILFGQTLYELALDADELQAALRSKTPRAGVLYCAPDNSGSVSKSPPSFWGCAEGESAYQAAYIPMLSADGDVVAVIGVEGSAEDVRELQALRRNLTLMLVLVVLALAITSALTSRRITKPIGHLVSEARRIGSGDLRHPIPRTRPDELGDLEASLDDMRLALSDRDQQMQMMLSGVAHEVRNPLGGIKLFLGLLDEDLAVLRQTPDSETRQHVAKIQRELDYLDRVVTEFLEFARRNRGLELERFLVRPFLADIAHVMHADTLARDLSLVIDTPPPTDSSQEPEITADRDRLRRVVLNLIRNAAQASPPNTTITVKFFVEPAPTQTSPQTPPTLCLQVIDQGSGISADNLTKVFQPFFTTREKGTGLGLALTRKILEDHDGSVSIDSTLGLGTTVTLRWPFRPDLPKPEMIIPEGWLG